MNHLQLPSCLQPWRCELVRLGNPHGDSGYLVNPRDVRDAQVLVSFGIGDNWMFEQDFYTINECAIIAYDAPSDLQLPHRDEFFTGNRKLVSLPVGPAGADPSDIFRDLPDKIFLKCDIEGSEWSILDRLLLNRHRFTGMVLELHDTEIESNMDLLLDFMCRSGLSLVHLHVNNWFYYFTDTYFVPSVLELTFSSDPAVILDRSIQLPHLLDRPNNPNNPEFAVAWPQRPSW